MPDTPVAPAAPVAPPVAAPPVAPVINVEQLVSDAMSGKFERAKGLFTGGAPVDLSFVSTPETPATPVAPPVPPATPVLAPPPEVPATQFAPPPVAPDPTQLAIQALTQQLITAAPEHQPRIIAALQSLTTQSAVPVAQLPVVPAAPVVPVKTEQQIEAETRDAVAAELKVRFRKPKTEIISGQEYIVPGQFVDYDESDPFFQTQVDILTKNRMLQERYNALQEREAQRAEQARLAQQNAAATQREQVFDQNLGSALMGLSALPNAHAILVKEPTGETRIATDDFNAIKADVLNETQRLFDQGIPVHPWMPGYNPAYVQAITKNVFQKRIDIYRQVAQRFAPAQTPAVVVPPAAVPVVPAIPVAPAIPALGAQLSVPPPAPPPASSGLVDTPRNRDGSPLDPNGSINEYIKAAGFNF